MKNPVKPRYNSCLEVLVSAKKLINFLGFFLQFLSKQPQQRKTQLRFEETNTESEMGSSDQIRETQKSETAVLPKITKFG